VIGEGANAKNSMTKEEGLKEAILAAIKRAAAELGRVPSRGELRRITGVSHYRVLAVFPTLREAVRAAGLEPNPKGEKISTEDLLADWKRVAEKLGRRPSRAEYVREGKYSAGALTVRFGSWSGISTAKVAKCAKEKLPESPNLHPSKPKSLAGDPGLPKNPKLKNAKAAIRASGARDAERSDKANRARLREHGEFVLHNFSRVPLAAVPAPVVGMRRVTEEVAQMVVNTLMGARSGDSMKGEVKRKFSPPTGGGGFTRHPAPSLTFSEEGFSAVSWTMLIWVATTIPWFL
jgi:hypothetical protein